MGTSPACMSVQHVGHWCPKRPEEGILEVGSRMAVNHHEMETQVLNFSPLEEHQFS